MEELPEQHRRIPSCIILCYDCGWIWLQHNYLRLLRTHLPGVQNEVKSHYATFVSTQGVTNVQFCCAGLHQCLCGKALSSQYK